MRALYWAIAACAWGPLGCGLISGLDQLSVGDASLAIDAGDAASAFDAPWGDADASIVTPQEAGEGGPLPVDASQVSIQCGGNLVCTGGQACCLSIQGGTYTCGSPCGFGSRVLKCDDPTDCSGNAPICCGTIGDGGELLGSGCGAACTGIALCDPLTISACKCTGLAPFGAGEKVGYCQ